MMSLLHRCAALCVGAVTLMGTAAHAAPAENWPAKPVTIVVSFAPGGATDLIGRILADGLSKAFGQPFVVENRPGAAGQVGTEYVAAQPPDGYTLLISATGHVMAPSTQPRVNYKPVESFEPIALLSTTTNLLVINPKLPPRNLAEFLEWGKTQPSIPFGSAGAGGATHLSGEMLRHLTGLKMTHVPYKGNGPAMSDLMAGHLPAAFIDSVSVGDLVRTGKMRAIAVTSARRSRLYPDVPTFVEAGYPDYDLDNWSGLYAPAGTPRQIVERLNAEVRRIMNSPEVLARMEQLGADSTNNFDAARFRQFVQDEVEKWRRTIELTGVKVQS